MAVLSMSKQEFCRLDVLLRVQSGRLRVADACELIGLRRRQIFRLLRNLKQDGATSLLSKRRGKSGNHRLPAEVRTLALSIVRNRYADFGPTFAAEKLADLHGCPVSRETLRNWMIADGLWVDRRHRLPSPHQPRRRPTHLGGTDVSPDRVTGVTRPAKTTPYLYRLEIKTWVADVSCSGTRRTNTRRR